MRTLILSILILACVAQGAFSQTYFGATAGVGWLHKSGGGDQHEKNNRVTSSLRPYLGVTAGNTMLKGHRYGLSLVFANRSFKTEDGYASLGGYDMWFRRATVNYLYLAPFLDLAINKKKTWFLVTNPAVGLRLGGKYTLTHSYKAQGPTGYDYHDDIVAAGAGYLAPLHFSLNLGISCNIQMTRNIVACPIVSFAPGISSLFKDDNIRGNEWRFGVNVMCDRPVKKS